MTSNIDLVDYLLVGAGILLLPLYLVGLILLGIFLWRLGDKWEKHQEQLEKDSKNYKIYAFRIDNPDNVDSFEKINHYSKNALEEMK